MYRAIWQEPIRLHAALWLPITLLGVVYMIREGLGWSDFGRATKIAESEAAT